jgi:hypothetical protein
VSLEAEGFNALANGADLLLGGMRLHDDEHGWLLNPRRNTAVYFIDKTEAKAG